MQNSMLCYNRDMDKVGLFRELEDGLTSQVGAGKDTCSGQSNIRASVYVQEILSHEAQKCVGVVGDKKER